MIAQGDGMESLGGVEDNGPADIVLGELVNGPASQVGSETICV